MIDYINIIGTSGIYIHMPQTDGSNDRPGGYFIIYPAWLGLDILTTYITPGRGQKWSGRDT